MKDLIIVGAGDMGRETAWLAGRINATEPNWNLLGFLDDNQDMHGKSLEGTTVLGGLNWLEKREEPCYVVCAIANSRVRKKVTDKLAKIPCVRFATLVEPSAQLCGEQTITIGEGSIVHGSSSFLAIHTVLGKHVILDLSTVGHDTVIGDCCTIYPGCNISGKVRVDACTELGTGTKVIQGLHITSECVLGAGTVVVRNIEQPGTYVGVPAQKIR